MNILLTSAGRRTYIVEYFKNALRGKGMVHASNSVFSPALVNADEYVVTPLIYSENYINFLLEYAKKNEISMLISLFDIDLPVLAKAKERFKKNGIDIIVSDYEITQICNDKWATYNFLLENGFNTPKTYIYLSEVKIDLKKGLLNFPVIIKPRWGMGSIGIYTAENIQELEVFYKIVKKEVDKTYLKYESNLNKDTAVLVQEALAGKEFGIDIFNDLKGNFLKAFVKEKTAMRSGETDGALTLNNPLLNSAAENLGKILKHIGNLDSDWFLVEGKPYVLEMNCRFGGGYPFTHLAGANLPKVLIDLLQTGTYNSGDLKMAYNLKMVKDIRPIKI